MQFTIDSISIVGGGKRGIVHDLTHDLDGEITLSELLDTLKSTLIISADSFLRQEQDAGFDKEPIMLVDGRRGKDILNVSPLGQIEFVSRQNISDIVIDAYEGLLYRSKVLHGVYIKSHYVFYNGKQVATDLESLKSWFASGVQVQDKDIIRIVNIQPYGRRLELLGVTAQRSNKKLEEKGRRNKVKTGVFFKVPNGTGIYSVRAIDQNGAFYEKHYQLLPENVQVEGDGTGDSKADEVEF